MHECLEARTESLSTLRELGPPDLVQLVKQATRNHLKQVYLASDPKLETKLMLNDRSVSTIMSLESTLLRPPA